MPTEYTTIRVSRALVARLDDMRDGLASNANGQLPDALVGDDQKSRRAKDEISYERLIAHVLDQRERWKCRVARAKRRARARAKKPKVMPPPDGAAAAGG